MGGPTSVFNQPLGALGGRSSDDGETNSFRDSLLADLDAANIDDATKNNLRTQVTQIGAVRPSEAAARFSAVMAQLNAKKAVSDKVAALYADAVKRAKETQSTTITKPINTSVAPQGGSTTLITQGTTV